MGNFIYLKFNWDIIRNQKEWLVDFKKLKEKILERIYIPNGWQVVVGQTNKKQTLTLIESENLFYTFFGTFVLSEKCFMVEKLDLILQENIFLSETVPVVFVAAPRANIIGDLQELQHKKQHPITSWYIANLHHSSMKNQLLAQMTPLKIQRTSRNSETQRFFLELDAFQVSFSSSYEKYVLYRTERLPQSLDVFIENAVEVGNLESWNEDSKRLIFTYKDGQEIPSKKTLKNHHYFLIQASVYEHVVKHKQLQYEEVIERSAAPLDYRHTVKKLLQPVLSSYDVQVNWSAPAQFLYYENEATHKKVFQEVFTTLVTSKRPLTVVSQHKIPYFQQECYLKEGIAFPKLEQKIKHFHELKHQFKDYEQNVQTTQLQIEALQEELLKLEQEMEQLEKVRLVQYDKVHTRKQSFQEVIQRKQILEDMLEDLQSTKSFLAASAEQLKGELQLQQEEQKRLKKLLAKLYEELAEFKKSEKTYNDIFRQTSQYEETKKSLAELELRLKQYKQLEETVITALDKVTAYLKESFENQQQKLEEIIMIDLTFKLTNKEQEIKALLPQLHDHGQKLNEQAVFLEHLNVQQQVIHQKLQALKIKVTLQAYPIVYCEKPQLEGVIIQLHRLLDSPPNRIISAVLKNHLREWQQNVSIYYEQFMTGYTYFLHEKTLATKQKQNKESDIQFQLHRYVMEVKNGLHEKKYETVHHFMRQTEIDISEIYLSMFQLNRQRDDLKNELKFYDDSLNEESFKQKKSAMQIEMTQFIASIRQLEQSMASMKENYDEYGTKLQQLEEEFKMHKHQITQLTGQYEQLKRHYEKMADKYKKTQLETNDKLQHMEVRNTQLERFQQDLQRLQMQPAQYENLDYLSAIETVYKKRDVITTSTQWLTIVNSDELSRVSGITVIENMQTLSPITLKQIAKQADYVIGFMPTAVHASYSPMLNFIERSYLLPQLMEERVLYDEVAVALLQLFYATKFNVKHQVHQISTPHVRNDEYITWIVPEQKEPQSVLEQLLQELHNERKQLLQKGIMSEKLRVKLFSDELSFMGKLHKNLKEYALRYHQVKLLKQHDQEIDVYIVHFSDNTRELSKQLALLKALLVARKPVVIISSARYLKQEDMAVIYDVLKQNRRIKESSRDEKWSTSIKLKN